MKRTVMLQPEYLKLIEEILKHHLNVAATIWMFGSRVTGNAKKFSDIDLVIAANEPISFEIMAAIASDFEESDLPYKVDIVDAATISELFRENIQSQLILL